MPDAKRGMGTDRTTGDPTYLDTAERFLDSYTGQWITKYGIGGEGAKKRKKSNPKEKPKASKNYPHRSGGYIIMCRRCSKRVFCTNLREGKQDIKEHWGKLHWVFYRDFDNSDYIATRYNQEEWLAIQHLRTSDLKSFNRELYSSSPKGNSLITTIIKIIKEREVKQLREQNSQIQKNEKNIKVPKVNLGRKNQKPWWNPRNHPKSKPHPIGLTGETLGGYQR